MRGLFSFNPSQINSNPDASEFQSGDAPRTTFDGIHPLGFILYGCPDPINGLP